MRKIISKGGGGVGPYSPSPRSAPKWLKKAACLWLVVNIDGSKTQTTFVMHKCCICAAGAHPTLIYQGGSRGIPNTKIIAIRIFRAEWGCEPPPSNSPVLDLPWTINKQLYRTTAKDGTARGYPPGVYTAFSSY